MSKATIISFFTPSSPRCFCYPEEEILLDFVDAPGRGWKFVLEFIPNALKRFYGQCAQFAVIGIDNDGNVDLDQAAVNEDPHHPRHDNHPGTPHTIPLYSPSAHRKTLLTMPDLGLPP
jgi:hypothetical protein